MKKSEASVLNSELKGSIGLVQHCLNASEEQAKRPQTPERLSLANRFTSANPPSTVEITQASIMILSCHPSLKAGSMSSPPPWRLVRLPIGCRPPSPPSAPRCPHAHGPTAGRPSECRAANPRGWPWPWARIASGAAQRGTKSGSSAVH